MKNITLLLVFSVLFLASCEKEVTPVPVTSSSTVAAIRTIHVEYAIQSPSGDLEVNYLVNVNGRMLERTERVYQSNLTISFETESQKLLTIRARNFTPSADEVLVSIYVDGILYKSNSTTTANEWATATGTPQ